MANNSINLVDLDFFSLKNDLKSYLKSNKTFKDYDFEGSNLNVLLDLLAYNTHKNAFYLNMVLSESFLDSSQLRSSVLSHAKELNYVPASRRSSKATIKVTFDTDGSAKKYTIPKGSLFSTVIKNSAYTFSIPETLTVTSANSQFTFQTDIYEGYYVKDSYIFLDIEEVQRFKLTNKTVDIDSISVSVYEDGNLVPLIFKRVDTLLGLSSTSQVFFIQPVGNGYYEIIFGDGILGRKPKINSAISIDYRISSGTLADGSRIFSMDFDPTNNGSMTTHTVETISIASGGGEQQSLDSIRFYAPRYFATQQRAVATDDYESLVLSKFSSNISDVAVYGGELVEPKQYGRVIVALKPVSSLIAPDYIKSEISNYLKNYMSIPTRIITADPDYIFLEINTTVQYDKNITIKYASELTGIVENNIFNFSSTNLEKFGNDFRYSRFVNSIDASDPSIVSNDTTIRLIKRIEPKINALESYDFSFDNQLHPARFSVNPHPVLVSSSFVFQDELGINYDNCFIRDDGTGNLIVCQGTLDEFVILNNSIGSLNHSTGRVIISNLRVNNYTSYISVYAFPIKKDIIVQNNKIIQIDLNDVTVNVIEKLE